MPCVFPILALKALHLAEAASEDARRDALAYAAGAVVATGALGALLLAIRAGGSAAGWAFQLQDPRTIVVLMLLASGNRAQPGRRVRSCPRSAGGRGRAGASPPARSPPSSRRRAPGRSSAPRSARHCCFPPAGRSLVFAALGLGLAIPFLAIAFIPALRERLPQPGPWMVRFQRFLAIPMAATAVGLPVAAVAPGGRSAPC